MLAAVVLAAAVLAAAVVLAAVVLAAVLAAAVVLAAVAVLAAAAMLAVAVLAAATVLAWPRVHFLIIMPKATEQISWGFGHWGRGKRKSLKTQVSGAASSVHLCGDSAAPKGI